MVHSIVKVHPKHKRRGWRYELKLLMKAQFSAQVASLCDYTLTILLAKLFDVFYLYATFCGSMMGGTVNCFINYRWVFKTTDCKKKYIAMKYLFVWAGTILLNTWGTFALTEWLTSMNWLTEMMGYYASDLFIFCKIFVSIVVGFLWSYQLQRKFVYRNRNIKAVWKYFK